MIPFASPEPKRGYVLPIRRSLSGSLPVQGSSCAHAPLPAPLYQIVVYFFAERPAARKGMMPSGAIGSVSTTLFFVVLVCSIVVMFSSILPKTAHLYNGQTPL